METISKKTEILIVGAGMAGLCAATDLQNAGHDVLVIDKGRGLGGRMASRRIGKATFDHGAQFVTARDERFTTLINEWVEADVAKEWYRTSGGVVTTDGSGHARWCGQPAMTAMAKHMAKSLTVQGKARLSTLEQKDTTWFATLESGEVIQANAVVLTPPVPQVLDLFNASKIVLSTNLKTQLEAISYERCIAVMAVLDSSIGIQQSGTQQPGIQQSGTQQSGTLSPEHDDVSLIIDNQEKGISELPAITIHATPEFSLEHWADERDAAGQLLLNAVQALLGDAKVIEYQTHGWLYSRPHKVEEASHIVVNESPPLLLAGDAFAALETGSYVEPRVEGAALSGWAAASALHKIMQT